MKRTTLILSVSLYAELKQLAAGEGRTLADVVERTLRVGLTALRAPRRRITLPSYDLGPFLTDPAERTGRERASGRLEGRREER